jgi:hypothetical protein
VAVPAVSRIIPRRSQVLSVAAILLQSGPVHLRPWVRCSQVRTPFGIHCGRGFLENGLEMIEALFPNCPHAGQPLGLTASAVPGELPPVGLPMNEGGVSSMEKRLAPRTFRESRGMLWRASISAG